MAPLHAARSVERSLSNAPFFPLFENVAADLDTDLYRGHQWIARAYEIPCGFNDRHGAFVVRPTSDSRPFVAKLLGGLSNFNEESFSDMRYDSRELIAPRYVRVRGMKALTGIDAFLLVSAGLPENAPQVKQAMGKITQYFFAAEKNNEMIPVWYRNHDTV